MCQKQWNALGIITLGFAAILSGCGHKGPERYEVGGVVTLSGKPIEVGTVNFIPIGDTQGPLCGANIENGEFHIPAGGGPIAGRYRVELTAMEKTGRKVPDMGGALFDERANVLPAKYCGPESELTVEVTPTGDNQFTFELSP